MNRGPLTVSMIGVVLLFIAAWHHVTEIGAIGATAGPLLGLTVDAGLACTLIYAGWWLDHTALPSRAEWSVARWTVGGGLVGGVLIALIFIAQAIEGRTPPEPVFPGLVAVIGGAVFGFIAGYYAGDLRRTNRWYESVFNNTFQFTGLLQPDGTVLAANDTALEFGGFDRDAVIGHSFPDLSWWTHSESVHDRVHAAISRAADGELVRYETDVQGVDGLRTIDFSAKPITDDHNAVSLIVVEGRDITAQTQQRQHLQVLQRIIRHNIRNDVTKLYAWTDQQATATDPDTRAAYASRIKETLDSWNEMTSKLSRLQQLVQLDRSRYQTVSVNTLITEVVTNQQAHHPNAEISTVLPEATGETVPTIVSDAIAEAIENAVCAATTEPPTVTVTVSEADTDWVEIEISDAGSGLPAMEASVLETGEETPLSHGSGTGVWLIRMVIKEAGGEITVSTTDTGTTLGFRLPTGNPGQIESK